MTVRAATEADVPDIVAMGARFYGLTSYARHAPLDESALCELALHIIEHGVLLLAVDDDRPAGMVGLVLAPLPFNPAVTFAHEVMWWVEPEARCRGFGRALLAAVEQACRERGASAIQMVHLTSSPPEAAAIYSRANYEHTESSFTKRL